MLVGKRAREARATKTYVHTRRAKNAGRECYEEGTAGACNGQLGETEKLRSAEELGLSEDLQSKSLSFKEEKMLETMLEATGEASQTLPGF